MGLPSPTLVLCLLGYSTPGAGKSYRHRYGHNSPVIYEPGDLMVWDIVRIVFHLGTFRTVGAAIEAARVLVPGWRPLGEVRLGFGIPGVETGKAPALTDSCRDPRTGRCVSTDDHVSCIRWRGGHGRTEPRPVSELRHRLDLLRHDFPLYEQRLVDDEARRHPALRRGVGGVDGGAVGGAGASRAGDPIPIRRGRTG